MKTVRVVVVGGGPAGLMAATQLLKAGCQVTVIDQKPAPARKFLVAGDGGFNLTHSEDPERFLQRYNHEVVRDWVRNYTPEMFRSWLAEIGIETYVGSSGKVFPREGIKPVQVLKAWTNWLDKQGINWLLRTQMVDFSPTSLWVETEGKRMTLSFDFLVLATGGGSWKKTGSDGNWLELFRRKNLPVSAFQSSNSGLVLPESAWLKSREGAIIKNCRLLAGKVAVAGDLVVTAYGLEGKPAYAVNGPLREQHWEGLTIDFKPQLTEKQLEKTLAQQPTTRKAFRTLKLPEVVYDWMRETLTKESFTNPTVLAGLIKAFPVSVVGLRPVDEVISTVGGLSVNAIDSSGKLHAFDTVYCCGEMLDWDAPTGGYLIQACVASGNAAGRAIRDSILAKEKQ